MQLRDDIHGIISLDDHHFNHIGFSDLVLCLLLLPIVCGLPTPNPNHAVVMSSFARRALDKMLRVVSELEILLGPGTADLGKSFAAAVTSF